MRRRRSAPHCRTLRLAISAGATGCGGVPPRLGGTAPVGHRTVAAEHRPLSPTRAAGAGSAEPTGRPAPAAARATARAHQRLPTQTLAWQAASNGPSAASSRPAGRRSGATPPPLPSVPGHAHLTTTAPLQRGPRVAGSAESGSSTSRATTAPRGPRRGPPCRLTSLPNGRPRPYFCLFCRSLVEWHPRGESPDSLPPALDPSVANRSRPDHAADRDR